MQQISATWGKDPVKIIMLGISLAYPCVSYHHHVMFTTPAEERLAGYVSVGHRPALQQFHSHVSLDGLQIGVFQLTYC